MDPFITSEVLYQLSYVGAGWILACGRAIVLISPGLSRELFQRAARYARNVRYEHSGFSGRR